MKTYKGCPVKDVDLMRRYIHRAGFTQKDVAVRLKFSKPTLSSKLRNGNWTVKEIIALAHLLELTDEDVLELIKPSKDYIKVIEGWIEEGKTYKRRKNTWSYKNIEEYSKMKGHQREIYRRQIR